MKHLQGVWKIQPDFLYRIPIHKYFLSAYKSALQINRLCRNKPFAFLFDAKAGHVKQTRVHLWQPRSIIAASCTKAHFYVLLQPVSEFVDAPLSCLCGSSSAVCTASYLWILISPVTVHKGWIIQQLVPRSKMQHPAAMYSFIGLPIQFRLKPNTPPIVYLCMIYLSMTIKCHYRGVQWMM